VFPAFRLDNVQFRLHIYRSHPGEKNLAEGLDQRVGAHVSAPDIGPGANVFLKRFCRTEITESNN
jgi:hypothetical protein